MLGQQRLNVASELDGACVRRRRRISRQGREARAGEYENR
jgi:hypothetical protein